MKTKHVVAIVVGVVVGIPVVLGATGFIAALMLPAFINQSEKAKEVEARAEAATAAKEKQAECMEQFEFDYCQEEYERAKATYGF